MRAWPDPTTPARCRQRGCGPYRVRVMRHRPVARLVCACALAWLGPAAPASAGVPIDSTSGSGAFGRWAVDGAGLPMYRYTLDQARAPFARQPELLGRTDAWHQK